MTVTALLFWIYLFLLSTMAFLPLGNSDHVVVSVSIDFPINSKQASPFYRVTYDYSRANWDGLCDHLRDFPSEDVFKLSTSAAASDFCEGGRFKFELMYISLILSIRSHLIHLQLFNCCCYCHSS